MVKELDNNKCWKPHIYRCLWGTVRQFLKKLDIELLCEPANQLLGIYTRELKIYPPKKLVIECSQQHFHNNQIVESIQISIS